jgi:hypothetical protein
MSDPFRRFNGLTYPAIQAKLERDGLTQDQIAVAIAELRAHRSQQANLKRQRQQSNKQWSEVIQTLQHERRIVRGMMRYKTKTPAPERDDFVAQYMKMLDTLYEKLQSKRRLDHALPEHGHWVDYVPDKIKQAFTQAADMVPVRDRAKFKTPFQRISPPALTDLRRARLLRYTRATLEAVIAKQEVDPDDNKAQRKEWLLREAIKRINDLPFNAHVPNHWADMVRDVFLENDDGEMVTVVKAKPTKRMQLAKDNPQALLPGRINEEMKGNEQYLRKLDVMTVRQPLTQTVTNLLNVTKKQGE